MNIERVKRPELIFGIVGPVGVDLDMIIEVLSTQLKRQNYSSDVVHVTQLMREVPSNTKLKEDNYFDKIKSRIEYADDVCRQLERADALAAITLPQQHSHVPMPADQCDLGYRQPLLKESANGFMPKIMEAEVIDTRSAPQPMPIQP